MRIVSLAAVLVFTSTAWTGGSTPVKMTFDKATPAGVPVGWKTGVTGKADGSVWKVAEDKSEPRGPAVLSQTSKSDGPIFNLCIAEDGKYKDIDISVAFKAVMGDKDQGGGILWRTKDNDNYYVVRMNPLEDNFRVYVVEGGKRKQLGTADVKAEAGKWHTIRVVHKGDKNPVLAQR